MRKIVFLMLFLCASIPAAAEDGSVTANSGREAGPRGNTVLPPLINEQYEYHDVCGCCEKDIQCDMMDKAIRWKDGNGYDSVTKWKVKWDYGYDRAAHFCHADSFRLSLDITIQLPRWVCAGNAPQSLKDKWESYIRDLIAHENSHADIAKRAAEELTRVVSRMPPVRTCRELDSNVQALLRDGMRKLDGDQQDFDQATCHGFPNRPSFP